MEPTDEMIEEVVSSLTRESGIVSEFLQILTLLINRKPPRPLFPTWRRERSRRKADLPGESRSLSSHSFFGKLIQIDFSTISAKVSVRGAR